MITTETDIQAEYKAKASERDPYLARARTYCEVTLPRLLALEDNASQTEETTGLRQSLGAELVSNLANKIMFSVMPARPFFKLQVPMYRQEFAEMDTETLAEINLKLLGTTQQATEYLASKGARVSVAQAIKHLLVCGNCVVHVPKKGNISTYGLNDYIVERKVTGELNYLITRDVKFFGNLEPDMQTALLSTGTTYDLDTKVNLYTAVYRKEEDSTKFTVRQALDTVDLKLPESSVSENVLPWLALTWDLQRGKNYSESLVGDHFGDFNSHAILNQAIVDSAVAASLLKFLVNPTGVTMPQSLQDSANGDFVTGNINDIGVLTLGKKIFDFRHVSEIQKAKELRLGRIFLSQTAVTRDAERVTAEEIRRNSQELETAFSGFYEQISSTLQKPLATLGLLGVKLPTDLAINVLDMTVATGFDALSKSSELDNVSEFFRQLSMLDGIPDDVRRQINMPALIGIVAEGTGVDYTKVLLSDQEQQQKLEEANAQDSRVRQEESNIRMVEQGQKMGA